MSEQKSEWVEEQASDAAAAENREEESSTRMKVRKRNGDLEPVDLNKIVRAITRSCGGLTEVDTIRVATRTISGLYDGATTDELDELSIQTAASLMAEEPQYSFLAARLLSTFIDKEVANQEIHAFSQSIRVGYERGLVSSNTFEFVQGAKRKLNDAIQNDRSAQFQYFGLRTVYDRYLLKDPESRKVIETPQYFFMRVACGLSKNAGEALEFYKILSSFEYMPSSPTLFNSGTRHPQMSSCYLLDSPQDNLEAIYSRYTDIAKLSKHAGGIGIAYHRVRAAGSLIRGTNGVSSGIVPFLNTLNASVGAVNQGGRRKGACCVYLETWHADIESFLELRENTGDHARRTHNLNLANWIPDLFMQRVEEDGVWSLFDPHTMPELCDLFGEAFEKAYVQGETDGKFVNQVQARDLYARMMRCLAQTGNGWMTFKDSCNRKSNQTGAAGNIVHSSNLCTEIVEVSSAGETAVCNLGSVNLSQFVNESGIDYEALRTTVNTAVTYLDRVVDINFYPTDEAGASNRRWRPVGLGLMGLQDVFFKLKLPFDSPEALKISTKIQEEMMFAALTTSCALAKEEGPHESFQETRMAKGTFPFELWGAEVEEGARWNNLRRDIERYGLRNSLCLAIAPTATIASITGVYECVEPQVSNLFKRETLSGDFLQINHYLIDDLKSRGLWTDTMRDRIKRNEGSVQGIPEIPEELQLLYRTAWELPQKSLIDMAAARGPFIDQGQSLNLFMATPTIGKLSSMYLYAWKKGLKTTYYLRSRPATQIAKATISQEDTPYTEAEALACSLENPESCEACQ